MSASVLGLATLLALAGPIDPDAGLPLATAPTPIAGPDVLAHQPGTPTTLFVNFDGAVLQRGCGNDPKHDCSALADIFDGYVGPFTGHDGYKFSILQATRDDVEDFGVRVVIERPDDSVDYAMVLYGDLGEQSFAGVAPYIDCGDVRGGDTSFSSGYSSANTGSTVILQEAAHTWGLEHVNAQVDTMNPFKTSSNQRFTDECHKIVANTDLDETFGACNQIHTLFCEAGFQNSYQEMLYLFGPPVLDSSPPTLKIVSPAQDSVHALPVSLPLVGEIEDDYDPQQYTIDIYRDGQLLFSTEDYVLDLRLENPPEGVYELTVRIADEGGNPAEDSVRFEILPEGSEVPGDTDDTDAGTDATGEADVDESGCRLGGPAHAPGPALLLLLAALRRRSPTRRRERPR